MKLLDTVMDALNSIFPDFLRTPASGSSQGAAAGRDATGGPEAESGFAAALVHFLGGSSSPGDTDAEGGVSGPSETAGELMEEPQGGAGGAGSSLEGEGGREGETRPGSDSQAGTETEQGEILPLYRGHSGLSIEVGEIREDAIRSESRQALSGPDGSGRFSQQPQEFGPGAGPNLAPEAGDGRTALGEDLGSGSGDRSVPISGQAVGRNGGAERSDAFPTGVGSGDEDSRETAGALDPRHGRERSLAEDLFPSSETGRGEGTSRNGGALQTETSHPGLRSPTLASASDSTRGGETAFGPQPDGGMESLARIDSFAGVDSPTGIDSPSGASGHGEINVVPTASTVSAAGSTFALDRDLEKLDPELQTKLSRVVSRMEEYGHQVKLVEGYRSPERQAALFEQGRTRPGQVVTWTQESLHSEGKAADLQVDGTWDNPRAYARLQRIAQEEGLRTLGAADAGHVQLNEEGSGDSRGARWSHRSEWERSPEMGSRPARVARVASPSGPARVAQVARPAQPGQALPPAPSIPARDTGPSTDGSGERNLGDLPESPVKPQLHGAEVPPRARTADIRPDTPAESRPPMVASALQADSGRARDEESADRTDEGVEALARKQSTREGSLSSQSWTPRGTTPVTDVRGAEALRRAGSVDRVNEIQALEEAMNLRAPGRIHLDLENADGLGTRLRLSLRGSQLNGTVDLSDPAAALRMKDRVGELHEALARQGLDARALALQGTRGMEPGKGAETDLVALLQDPLAGLSRVLNSREGSMDPRGDRRGEPREDLHGESERFRNPAQRDRNKEERK